MMTKTTKINQLISFMDERYPNVGCELKYNKDYELVIAVMLSAQTTDVAVNKVTAVLFDKYNTLEKLNNASLEEIEEIIHAIGLFKNKAKNLKGITDILISDFNGVVPSDKDILQKLPGVGNKTAGVIRAEIFKIPDLPVDTHILRISKRLNLVKNDADPLETEMVLKKLLPEDKWIKTHHQLIHFGRDICTARSPKCQNCKLCDICTKK